MATTPLAGGPGKVAEHEPVREQVSKQHSSRFALQVPALSSFSDEL